MDDLSREAIRQNNQDLTDLLESKNKTIQELQERIQTLERNIVQLQNPEPLYQKYQLDFLNEIQQENYNYFNQLTTLELRYLHLKAEKNEKAAQIKELQYKITPPSPKSTVNAAEENIKLNAENQKLKSLVECMREDKKDLEDQLAKANQRAIAQKEFRKKLQSEGKQSFDQMQEKLQQERDGKSTEDQEQLIVLKSENQSLSSTLESQTAAFEKLNAEYQRFLETLSNVLNTDPNINSITEAIRHLSELPKQIELLQKQSNSMSVHQPEDLNVIIKAIKEIIANLSPNELQLKPQSELRQLFAGIVNMLNAALQPKPTEAMLTPHIRAVVYQARYFVGKSTNNPLPDMTDKRPSPSSPVEFTPKF